MLGAEKRRLIYICNPNNPTASITPKDELRDFIAKTPPETMVPVDEAYFHFADSPDYESCNPTRERPPEPDCLAHVLKNLRNGRIALRLLRRAKGDDRRMRRNQMWDSVNCMALAAATASLDDPEQSERPAFKQRSENNSQPELEKMGYKIIPSQANFIMFDCKRPVVPLIKAMKDEIWPFIPGAPRSHAPHHREES